MPQNAVFTRNGLQLCLKNIHHHHHLPSPQICLAKNSLRIGQTTQNRWGGEASKLNQ